LPLRGAATEGRPYSYAQIILKVGNLSQGAFEVRNIPRRPEE